MEFKKLIVLLLIAPAAFAAGAFPLSSSIPKDQRIRHAVRSLEAKGKSGMIRNAASASESPEPRAVCASTVTLTSGVPYSGTTSGETNKFYNAPGVGHFDYPNLIWNEQGPDVVHQITVSPLIAPVDLRIHLVPDPVARPDLDVILIPPPACNTGNWLYAGDDTILYPNAPAGTYSIIVDGYTATDVGAYTLTVAAAAGLLLVDDDGSGGTLCDGASCTDVHSYYYDAWNAMSPKPALTEWNVVTQGQPTDAVLNNAKYIIVFTGMAYGTSPYSTPAIIPKATEDLLMKYLDLGGRLMIAGQDLLWEYMAGTSGRLPDGSLYNSYMQVDQVYQDVWSTAPSGDNANYRLNAIKGNPLGDTMTCADSFAYFDQYTTAPIYAYTDSILTRYGEPVYTDPYAAAKPKSDLPVGVRYSNYLVVADTTGGGTAFDYFKTVYLSFAPEADNPANRLNHMTTLLQNTIAWFDLDNEVYCNIDAAGYYWMDVWGYLDDSVSGNNNGIPDPGETFDFVVVVDNYDTVAHNVKIYQSFTDHFVTLSGPYCSGVLSLPAYSSPNPGEGYFVYTMTLSASTPVGYEFRPGFNIVNTNVSGSTESYCTRIVFGSFVGQAQVLLVKDEELYPNTTGVDVYTSILSQLGYTYALWDTSVFGTPGYTLYSSNDQMKSYPFVIWFTGFDSFWTLTPDPNDSNSGLDPQTELTGFLTNRFAQTGDAARLILSSQDYLFDKYKGINQSIPSGDFAFTQLKVGYVTQDYIKDTATTLKGVSDSFPTQKMALPLATYGGGGYFPTYADKITGNFDESGTQFQWTYAQTTAKAAIGNLDKNRASKYIFMPFPFENAQDAVSPAFGTKKRFLEKVMCQMRMTAADTVPPCGYYRITGEPCLTNDLLKGYRTNATDAYFYWTDVPWTGPMNTAGEPLYAGYGMFGRLDDPNQSVTSFPFLGLTSDAFWTATDAVPSGHCFYYQMKGYVDNFGQSNASPCTSSIFGTVSGDTAAGVLLTLSGAAVASTTTDAAGNYAFNGLANGSYTVTPSKTGYTFSPTSLSPVISNANQTAQNFTAAAACNANAAAFNATYQAPACTATGKSCDTGAAIIHCTGASGEPNQPNTINDSCADATLGTCSSDESVEQLTIATNDGSSCLAVGRTVTVTAKFWCFSTSSDYVAIYYSTSATTPAWTLLGSVANCPGTGLQTVTRSFTLSGSAGAPQAVRAQITYSTSPTTACQSGNYNDRDDLVFQLQ